jgi:hypothetical protein
MEALLTTSKLELAVVLFMRTELNNANDPLGKEFQDLLISARVFTPALAVKRSLSKH